MANEQIIDTVIDPKADEQVSELTKLLAALDIQMASNIKSANTLNTAISNSKSYKELNTNATNTTVALEKVNAAQNKTAITAANLEKANIALATAQNRQAQQQDKAAQAAQKALSPYQQLSKKLDELRATAKNVGATFGEHSEQFKAAAKPVQELDEKLKAIDQTLGQSQRNVGNYGKAFSEAFTEYIPFLGGTIKVRENIEKLGEAVGVSEEKLGTLGGAFANFAVGGFAVAIGLAINYLNQFQGYADKVDIFFAGIKGRINELGKDVVQAVSPDSGKESAISKFIQKYKDALASTPVGGLLKKIFIDTTDDAANAAEQVERLNIALENNENITDTLNARDQAQANNKRTLADDKLLPYNTRKQLLDQAEGLEARALERTKEDSKERINVAVQQANVLGTLSDKEIQRLKDGDIKLANELFRSTDARKQITKDAYKNLVEGYAKQTAAEEMATQNILKIRNDRDQLILRDERELAMAQRELDTARIQGAQLTEKLILENDDKNYDTKLKALDDYVTNSKRLAKIKLDNDLDAAGIAGRGGLDPKIVALKQQTARQDYQNELTKIDSEAIKQRQELDKKETESQRKNLQDLLAANKISADQAIEALQEVSDKQLSILQEQRNKETAILDAKFARGKIDQKKYNDELLAIDDQYNIDRLGQEAFYQQSILEIKEAALANDLELAQNRGATPDEINQIKAKSGVKQQQSVVDKAGIALGNALGKQGNDQAKGIQDAAETRRKAEIFGLQQTMRVVDDLDKLRQKSYENEIARLEKLAQQVDDNANAEKEAVNNSIASSATKAREIAVIDARANAQKKAIQADENRIKQKEAIAEKEAAISKIILETAIAAIKAPAELGPILGLAAVPIVLALGAVELAAALAAPIPKFAKGGTTTGGLVLWGEAGMESARLPDGTVRYSTGPTLEALPRGTEITPHMQLMQQIRPEAVRYAGGEQVGWKEVIHQLKKMEPKKSRNRFSVNVDMGYENYKRSYLTR